jgi:hypothetical protein
MGAIRDLIEHIGLTLSELGTMPSDSVGLLHAREALWAVGMLGLAALGIQLRRVLRADQPGRDRIALPALVPRDNNLGFAFVRHLPFTVFLCGLPFFVFALAAPHTAFVQEETSYPGHRIAILIDASLSMNTAFSTKELRAGNTFLANVSAAEYFVKRRMDGSHRDLVALIEFGSQAYIVTPFTNDYENILLSIGLIGTPEEYRRFPDHGTLIMLAINRGVELFRTFDFLQASGNLMVIFSDGQDTHALYEDRSLDEILQEAADNEIPVYFIRTSYDQELGDILPDKVWKDAVERTGGRFFPAANEGMIIDAVHEIDRLAAGRITSKRYVTRSPRFAGFALIAILLWALALGLILGIKRFRTFP